MQANQHYNLDPKNSEYSNLRGDFIGEVVRLQPGDIVCSTGSYAARTQVETYTLHLGDNSRPQSRLTLPANGHILIHGVSPQGWSTICREIEQAAGDIQSWRGIEQVVFNLPILQSVQVQESRIGPITRGALH